MTNEKLQEALIELGKCYKGTVMPSSPNLHELDFLNALGDLPDSGDYEGKAILVPMPWEGGYNQEEVSRDLVDLAILNNGLIVEKGVAEDSGLGHADYVPGDDVVVFAYK